MVMILIVGGTGTLGSATTRRLLTRGTAVRVMTRTPEKAAELGKLGAEVVQGDLLEKASLTRACRGVEKVLAAAHSVMGRGREASKYVDLQGHKDLIDAARTAGVKHFVYTSAYQYNPTYDAVPFFHFKRQIEHYLQTSGLSYTILRPTAFMEAHAEMFIGQPILGKGKVSLFGKGQNPRNFVAADNVAQFAVMALSDPTFSGQTVDIGGPENLTNMEVVRLYEKLDGRTAKVSHVPLGMLKVMYRLMRPFHPGLSQIMQFSIYADTTDNSFDPGPMLAAYPKIKFTPLGEWAGQRIQSGALSVPLAAA
jgi:NADH dehydrogenase